MIWSWPAADEGRIKRAKSVKFRELNLTADPPYAFAVGSGAEDYEVTPLSCTCADFAMTARKRDPQPCKHMLALAMNAGILNDNGLTSAQQIAADRRDLRDQLARAYGYYYLFDFPVLSDSEYDALKARLAALPPEE